MLQCADCGTTHPAELRRKWGQDGNGEGLGPRPVCPTLIGPDNQPIQEGDTTTPGHVCRGELVAAAGSFMGEEETEPDETAAAPRARRKR